MRAYALAELRVLQELACRRKLAALIPLRFQLLPHWG